MGTQKERREGYSMGTSNGKDGRETLREGRDSRRKRRRFVRRGRAEGQRSQR